MMLLCAGPQVLEECLVLLRANWDVAEGKRADL